MTITISPEIIIKTILVVMIASVAIAAYLRGWCLFFTKKPSIDTADKVFGGGLLWAIAIGGVWIIYAIVVGFGSVFD